jgi:hypothetical protein
VRSGPGGQHRNRTSSGIFLEHRPSGITAAATERRRQGHNRSVATSRLRFQLAIDLRTPSVSDTPACGREAIVRDQYFGHPLRIGDDNPDKPAVLALILNDLHAAAGQPSLVAKLWKTNTSRIVALLKTHRPAFELVNRIRRSHDRRSLK